MSGEALEQLVFDVSCFQQLDLTFFFNAWRKIVILKKKSKQEHFFFSSQKSSC